MVRLYHSKKVLSGDFGGQSWYRHQLQGYSVLWLFRAVMSINRDEKHQ